MRSAVSARRHVVQRGEVLEVLARGELPVQAALAGQHRPEPPADVARPANEVVAEDRRGARGRLEQRGKHSHRGRLARAVGTEQTEHLSLGHAQVDGVDRPEGLALIGLPAHALPDRPPALLEVLGEAVGLDGQVHVVTPR